MIASGVFLHMQNAEYGIKDENAIVYVFFFFLLIWFVDICGFDIFLFSYSFLSLGIIVQKRTQSSGQ